MRRITWLSEAIAYAVLIASITLASSIGYHMISGSVGQATAWRQLVETTRAQSDAANNVLGYAVGLRRIDSRAAPTQFVVQLRDALAKWQLEHASAAQADSSRLDLTAADQGRLQDLSSQAEGAYQDMLGSVQALLAAAQPGAAAAAGADLPIAHVAATQAAYADAQKNLGTFYDERSRTAVTRAQYEEAALAVAIVILVVLEVVFVVAPVHRATKHYVEHSVRSQEQNKRIGSEVARHVAERDRREAEAQFRALFRDASLGVALTDELGHVLDTNRALQELLGYSADELCGQQFGQWTAPGIEGAPWPDTVPAGLFSQTSPSEVRYVRKNGTTIWVEHSLTRVSTAGGRTVVWIGMVKDIADRKTAEERLRHDATHDALTGLGNRGFMHETIERAFRRASIAASESFAVLMIDLDRFKYINDARGHRYGDAVLCEVGRQLERWARDTDVVARFGGDEFVALLRGVSDAAAVVARAEELRHMLEGPLSLGGSLIGVSASIGICIRSPEFSSADDMLAAADAAVYRAKGEGRARAVVFDARMAQESRTKTRLAADLVFALQRDELWLAYQPIFDLQSARCVGFEALLRWSHPELGAIWPGFFIQAAEDSGLIRSIGNWVTRRASGQLAEWRRAFPDRDLSMNVNLSAQQFTDPRLLPELKTALRASGIPGGALSLELTESIMLDTRKLAATALEGLRHLGTRLVLDDFGVGYSSLNYLQQLPIDGLKIDRSFILGRAGAIASPQIVRMLIALSDSLGIDVVAEGVEDAAQVTALQTMSCRFAQGFYLSRPLDAQRATEFLSRGALIGPAVAVS